MTHIEQSALVLALSAALRKRGSWAGETHVQKAGYFLQRMLEVPLDVKYILYKHGPFSFQLRGIISEMEAEEFIRWEPKPYPYGPSMVAGPASAFALTHAKSPAMYRPQIEFVAEKLADKKVADLERLATALFVSLEPNAAEASRARRLTALKPHISLQEAEEAVIQLDRIQKEAEQGELVLRNR